MPIRREQLAEATHPENERIAAWLERISQPDAQRTEFPDPTDVRHKIVVFRDQIGRPSRLFQGISAASFPAPRFVIWEENPGQLAEIEMPFGKIPSEGYTLNGMQYKKYAVEEKYYISASGIAIRRIKVSLEPSPPVREEDLFARDLKSAESFRPFRRADYQMIARFSAKIREWSRR